MRGTPSPLRFTRRAVLGVGAASLAAAALPTPRVAGQSAQTPAASFGLPGIAEPAFEFVGRIDQRGGDFTSYGYLTHAAGLNQDELFTNTDPVDRTEASARLTFHGKTFLTARSILDNLFSVTSDGEIRFYASDTPTSSFGDPDSFAAGTAFAVAGVRFRSVVNVQAPASGIASGTGWFLLTSATPVTIAGQDLTLEGVGTPHSVTFTGQGTLEEPTEPRSYIVMSGGIIPGTTAP